MNTEVDRNTNWVGVMSGTSGDGIDAALCRFTERDGQVSCELVGAMTRSYPEKFSDKLRHGANAAASELSALSVQFGRRAADVVEALLDREGMAPGQVRAVGSHGHTVYHDPDGTPARTMQIGEESEIAERTGIPVIGDFRTADVAAGGEGAPLIPLADWHLWRNPGTHRVLVNLGGFVNPTFLPADGDLEEVVAFDSGPGNVLLDRLARRTGIGPYDENGECAARGTPIPSGVERALSHPFFDRPPPRSTGRQSFDEDWMSGWLEQVPSDATAEDLLATGTRIVARHLADALASYLPAQPDELLLAGGGRHNRALLEEIRSLVDESSEVMVSEQAGIDGDAREAAAFALFAYLAEQGRVGNVPSATGARHRVIAGKRTPPVGRPMTGPS